MAITPAVGESRGPTERTRWEAARDTLAHPAAWQLSHWLTLFGLFVLLAVLALWAMRPGSLLGGAAPLQASLAYASNADGTYVYRLQEPPSSAARLAATLQSIYDAHKAAAGDGPMTVTLLRRAVDPSGYVVGGGDPNGPDVVGRVVRDGTRREAAQRTDPKGPFEPTELDW